MKYEGGKQSSKAARKEKERVVDMLVSRHPSGTCIMPRPESRGSIQPWAPECVEFKAWPWYVEDWIKRQYL